MVIRLCEMRALFAKISSRIGNPLYSTCEQNLHLGHGFANPLRKIKTAHIARKLDVGQNYGNAELRVLQSLHCFRSGARLEHAKAAVAQIFGYHIPGDHVAVNDENRLGCGFSRHHRPRFAASTFINSTIAFAS